MNSLVGASIGIKVKVFHAKRINWVSKELGPAKHAGNGTVCYT
jgi:hypothetical protein